MVSQSFKRVLLSISHFQPSCVTTKITRSLIGLLRSSGSSCHGFTSCDGMCQWFSSSLFTIPNPKGGICPHLGSKSFECLLSSPEIPHKIHQTCLHLPIIRKTYWLLWTSRMMYLYLHIFTADQCFSLLAVGSLPYQLVALPIGILKAPLKFTNVLSPVLALLIVGYLDKLLLSDQAVQSMFGNVSFTPLEQFGWILKLYKSSLELTYYLDQGLVLDTFQTRVFFPQEKKCRLSAFA